MAAPVCQLLDALSKRIGDLSLDSIEDITHVLYLALHDIPRVAITSSAGCFAMLCHRLPLRGQL
jgi:hypothetical protein